MRKHIRLGGLVLLLSVIAFAVYSSRTGATEVALQSHLDTSAFVGTIRLQLPGDQLARLNAESPRLTLETDDGVRTLVLVWRVSNGQAVLQQFHNLRPTHYTTLEVVWPNGTAERVSIHLDLSEPSQG